MQSIKNTVQQVIRLVLAAGLVMCLTLFSTGCAQEETSPASVVATFNGEPLSVTTLTDYIESVRSKVGSPTNAAWEAYLADVGYDSADAYWNYLIRHYGREILIDQKCDELNITVSNAEIDARIDTLKEAMGANEENSAFLWDAYLEGQGLSEEDMRSQVAYFLRRDKLYAQEVPQKPVDREELQTYANTYAAFYQIDPAQIEDGVVDLDALDVDTLERIEQDATGYAWDVACEAYVDALYDEANIEILIEHQYDVPGQSYEGETAN